MICLVIFNVKKISTKIQKSTSFIELFEEQTATIYKLAYCINLIG